MANIEITFRADSIMRLTTFQMFLPNDVPSQIREGNPAYGREPKTLFLLHGYSGFYKDWALGSLAHEMAMKYNLAVVMLSGDNSFYVDGKGIGHSYARYVGSELVDYVRATFGLATEERDTSVSYTHLDVYKRQLRQYLEAAQGIIGQTMWGEPVEILGRSALLLEHRDIGIVY